MARKKIARGLPPLSSRLTFKAKKHKGAQLLEILRDIAIANQQEEPQVFYPIREVARHLGVPVSTQRESAIASILRDWHANDAITSVVVVRGIEISAAKEELLKTLLEEEGIAYEFRSAGDHPIRLVTAAVDSSFSAAVAAVRFSA